VRRELAVHVVVVVRVPIGALPKTSSGKLQRAGIRRISGPTRLTGAYVVIQRLEPELLWEGPEPTFARPEPDGIELEPLVLANSGDQLANSVAQMRELMPSLKLVAAEGATVDEALRLLETGFAGAGTEEARLTAFRDGMNLLHRGVSETTYARVITVPGRGSRSSSPSRSGWFGGRARSGGERVSATAPP
jgi:hypothetical protein